MATTLTTPQVIGQPFAASGDKTTLPETTTTAGAASLNKGLPPECSLAIADGGAYVRRTDLNGLGNLATSLNFFMQNGGQFTFNADVALAIGGYPLGAVLWYFPTASQGYAVRSLKNNNTDNFVTTPSKIDGVSWTYVSIFPRNTFVPFTAYTGGSLIFERTTGTAGTYTNTWTLANLTGIGLVEANIKSIKAYVEWSGDRSSASALTMYASCGGSDIKMFGVPLGGNGDSYSYAGSIDIPINPSQTTLVMKMILSSTWDNFYFARVTLLGATQ